MRDEKEERKKQARSNMHMQTVLQTTKQYKILFKNKSATWLLYRVLYIVLVSFEPAYVCA